MPDDVNNNDSPSFHLFSQWFQPGGRPITPIIDGSADRTIVVESFGPEPEDEYVPLVQFSSAFDKGPYRRARNGSIGGGLLWHPPSPLREDSGDGDGADLGNRMALVGRLITSGRAAFKDRRLYEVEGHYRAALDLLEDRIDSRRYGSARLHRAFFDGDEYLNEAVFEVAAFNTDPNNIHAINTRLDLIERNSTDEHGNVTDSYTYARVLLARAFTLMRYASATDIQDVQYYKDAEEMVRTAMELLTDEPDDYFAAELLLIPLVEMQMERAHHRGDRDARKLHKARLIEQLKIFTRRHRENRAAKRIDVALMVNHAVRLFGRMGLWEDALEWAIRITENDAYRRTRPARDLLSDPLFEPLVENGKFIIPEVFKKRRPWFKSKLKRAWAALDNAHTRGIGQSLGAASLGVLTGLAVDYAATGGESGSFLPAFLAMLFSIGNKLWNGWITEEARNADWFNRYEGTSRQSARHAADMAIRGVGTLFPWWGLMEAISIGPEFYKEFDETLGRAGDLWMDFFRWIGDIAVAPFYQDTYGHIYDAYRSYVNELSNTHPAWAIADMGYVTYLGFTAKHYLTWLVRPNLRKQLNKKRMFMNIPADLFYLPGAIFLGAQLGAIINPDRGLFDRLIRSSIATAEGLGMLFCGGVMALGKHKGFRESTKAMWDALAGRDRNILISLGITAGVSSALGGLMGSGPAELLHPGQYVARGMGTSLGLLPLVYLVSGAMKQTIGWPESAKAAWQDAKDFNLPTRGAIAVAGGLEAFWTPYTFNRLIRAAILDLPLAALRTVLGWDTNPGQLVFSLGNLAMINHFATSVWVESVDTTWERDSTVENLEEQDSEKIRDNWKKAGLHTLPYHPLEPHSLGDAAYPLWAISRAVSPPPFPQRPEPHFFASQYQLITNGYYQEFDERHMDILLRQVARLILEGSRKNETDDWRVQAERQVFMSLGRSWVKTLWLARDDPRHGEAIQSFFRKYPWIPYVVKVKLDEAPEIKESRFRAIKRWRVRRAVRETFRSYRRAVMEHAARKKRSLMHGLNVSGGKPPSPEYTGPAFTGERRMDKEDKNGGGNPPPSPGAGTGGASVPPASQSKPRPPTGSAAAKLIISPDSIPDSMPRPSLGSFWEEEAPQKQEVIIKPMSARELRRRRARNRAKKGQSVILTGARPAPPGSANVPQIILATEAALKPLLP